MYKSVVSAKIWYLFALCILVGDCCRSGSMTEKACCIPLENEEPLDGLAPVIEQGGDEVDVFLRFDHESVVALLQNSNHGAARYYYSKDGGVTWRLDNYLTKMYVDNGSPKDGQVQPWEPHPTDQNILYRTVHKSSKSGGALAERSSDGGKTWVRLKNLIIGCGAILEGAGYIPHPLNSLTIMKFGAIPGLKGRFGMYLSFDGGDSFRYLYEADLVHPIGFGTPDGKLVYGAGPHGTLLKSVDGGETWRLIGQNDFIGKTRYFWGGEHGDKPVGAIKTIDTTISRIVIDPIENNRVYVLTSKGLLRTEDGGNSWCIVNTNTRQVGCLNSFTLVPGNNNALLLGTNKGLMRSIDRGCHWEKVDVLARVVEK